MTQERGEGRKRNAENISNRKGIMYLSLEGHGTDIA
jgi:hypothetical protein